MFSKIKSMIIKTFLYQIVLSFLGVMLYSALSGNPLLKAFAIIVSVGFFWYILFSQTSDMSSKIAESDIAHKSDTPKYAGFLASFIAFIPSMILSIISMISLPSQKGAGYVAFLLNKLLLNGMYTGIAQKIYPTSSELTEIQNSAAIDAQSPILLICVIPGIIICGIAFIIGYNKFSERKKK